MPDVRSAPADSTSSPPGPGVGRPNLVGTGDGEFPTAPALAPKIGTLPQRLRTYAGAMASRLTSRPHLILYAAVLSFVTVYAGQQYERYLAFKTYAWDLGLSNQAFYTTLFDHRFFYYTADLPSGFSGSLALATHFSPFLALLLPFYAILPTPPTLIVLQWLGLGLAALPLYALTKTELHSTRIAVVVAVVYLISPITALSGWYDFHPEAFIPVTVLAALYFYRTHQWGWFLVSWVLALSVTEPIAVLLGIFAGATIARGLAFKTDLPLKARFRRPELLAALAALTLAALWLTLAYLVILSQNAVGGTFGAEYGTQWSVLGASSIAQVIPVAVLHPAAALAALEYGGPLKIAFVLILFGSVGFLPIIGRGRYLLPICGWLALAVLSNNPPYYQFGAQYTCYVLPFLFAGTVGGIAFLTGRGPPTPTNRSPESPPAEFARVFRFRARSSLGPARRTVLAVGIVLVGILATSAVSSPLLPAPLAAWGSVSYGLTSVTPHDSLLQRVIGLIPAQAPVLTTNAIFPEVSGRIDAFTVPFASFFAGNNTFVGVLDSYVAQANYVLFDYTVDKFSAWTLDSVANLSAFGVLAEADGIVLYERAWGGPPAIYSPTAYTIQGGSLASMNRSALGEQIVRLNATGTYGLHVPRLLDRNWTLYGPGLSTVPPGMYRESFNLTVMSNVTGALLRFDTVRYPLLSQSTVVNPSAAGRDYTFRIVEGPYETLDSTRLMGNPTTHNVTVTVTIPWFSPAVWYVNAQVLTPYVSFTLNWLQITEVSAG